MAGGRKLVLGSALAAYAMTVVVRPVEAPELEIRTPGYVYNHELIPVPIMGIRGEVRFLYLPLGA